MIASLARVQRGRNGFSAAHKAIGAKRTLATPAADGRVPTFHPSRVPPYTELLATLETVRQQLNRPLTLSEKILYSHLRNPEQDLAGVGADVFGYSRQKVPQAKIDRLAMQDASAQMALLQFMTCGLPRTAIPSSVHCDHLIQAFEGAEADLSVPSLPTRRSLLSSNRLPRSTVSSSGVQAPVSFTRLFSRTTQHPVFSCSVPTRTLPTLPVSVVLLSVSEVLMPSTL